ncbi:hypothetical protein ABZP36_008613 [Zizania latifolia]
MQGLVFYCFGGQSACPGWPFELLFHFSFLSRTSLQEGSVPVWGGVGCGQLLSVPNSTLLSITSFWLKIQGYVGWLEPYFWLILGGFLFLAMPWFPLLVPLPQEFQFSSALLDE